MNNFVLSTDKEKLDIDFIHHFLSVESYWAKDIPLHTVKKSIENSFCVGIYENNQQVGFARVITDYATFGYLADVFVNPKYRSLGLSKLMMEYIINHPDLQGFRRWLLATSDAHGLYEKYGFKMLGKPERMMEISKPTIYTP